ncbi:MAG: endopeptidase La [Gammaproteobacteria bacterium]|nr:endopeptidase La [Gammaproteobacteria bacterium]
MAVAPVLPLKNLVIYPGQIAPIAVGREKSLRAVTKAMESNNLILTVLQRDSEMEDPVKQDLYTIGSLCTIKRVDKRNSGAQVIAEAQQRVQLHRVYNNKEYMSAQYAELTNLADIFPKISASALATHATALEYAQKIASVLNPDKSEQVYQQFVGQYKNPITQMYRIASYSKHLHEEQAQEILEIDDVDKLMEYVLEVLKNELSIAEIQLEIQSSAHEGMEQQQREHLLRQQKRAIEQALGEGENDDEIAELKEQLRQANIPENARKEVDRELRRLARMSPHASDFQVARSYLELVAELPWNVVTEDNLELGHAKEILEEDHFGLEDVKDRILESLAVLKLNPEAKASILCFVGPPGVGKTSLGQSIARAMGRKFERMSLGGLHDEAELRGHRRTYIGSMPGRILQAIRRCGVRNPVLMLDELDKLGRDFRGDPSAALMEILDPAQNIEFRDNYLNLPFDLSKVFFITTANTLEGILRPLLDRLEVIELTGYSELEKLEIARRFLIPRQTLNAGLQEPQMQFTDGCLKLVVRRYTRLAGVRNLERTIEIIARKRAKNSLLENTTRGKLSVERVVELLGPEKFREDRNRRTLTNGVATGLAWTEAGGDVLYVEASLTSKDDKVTITGHVGQVMQESAKAARSYIWSVAEELHIDREAIEESGVHIHIPAGAVPKDGPSAGITMATALASAYSSKIVRDDIAMTGELTLSGLVLPVGGVREKILAAHRSGIRHVILPKDNASELEKLPTSVREDMEISLVETLTDVVKIAIPNL